MVDEIREIRYALIDLSEKLNVYLEEYKGESFINKIDDAKESIDESVQHLIAWQHNFFRDK